MADRQLEGKTALITGAGRGLGREMAEALATAGAKVALLDVDRDVLADAAKAVEAAGGQGCALAIQSDVTDKMKATAAIEEVMGKFGGLDILINDAAMGPQYFAGGDGKGPKFWEIDPELWLRVITVNSYGPQLMASVAVPHLIERGWGRVINVTTSLDTMYRRGSGAYGPSKAALEANTHIMAEDLEGTGVTANVLIPGGAANTRMIADHIVPDRASLVQPHVMRAPAVWLSSAASDGINGRRLIAALWDEDLPLDQRIEQAGAPVAWSQLPSRAIRPAGTTAMD
jgi:NAD(P)-dependent dehydrogenase (short-subunit alcohol dehydrogenase family)